MLCNSFSINVYFKDKVGNQEEIFLLPKKCGPGSRVACRLFSMLFWFSYIKNLYPYFFVFRIYVSLTQKESPSDAYKKLFSCCCEDFCLLVIYYDEKMEKGKHVLCVCTCYLAQNITIATQFRKIFQDIYCIIDVS